MIVQLKCCCYWSLQKQQRIAALVADRAKILLGQSTIKLVKSIIFVDNINPAPESILLFPSSIQSDICLSKNDDNTYTFYINSAVLFGMVKPGSGQAHFDELISFTKSMLYQNQRTYGT